MRAGWSSSSTCYGDSWQLATREWLACLRPPCLTGAGLGGTAVFDQTISGELAGFARLSFHGRATFAMNIHVDREVEAANTRSFGPGEVLGPRDLGRPVVLGSER